MDRGFLEIFTVSFIEKLLTTIEKSPTNRQDFEQFVVDQWNNYWDKVYQGPLESFCISGHQHNQTTEAWKPVSFLFHGYFSVLSATG